MKLTLALVFVLFAAVTGFSQSVDEQFDAQLIPRNSKVFIEPFTAEGDKATGFENYLTAALRKKKVPLIIVTDLNEANFVISGSADKKGAGWAKKVFLADFRSTTSASFQVIKRKKISGLKLSGLSRFCGSGALNAVLLSTLQMSWRFHRAKDISYSVMYGMNLIRSAGSATAHSLNFSIPRSKPATNSSIFKV